MALENTHFSFLELHNLFTNARQIFFIGIGGVSMSTLADYSLNKGKVVFGYDRCRNTTTKRLEGLCHITYKSTPDNVDGMDLVVYSNAIDKNNFEYKRAREKKIPTVSRANLLGYFISQYETKIGICGMHGKSTTTAMLEVIFSYASRGPSVFCGAKMKNVGANSIFGKGRVCVFEACEYQDSFLSLPVTDAGILNIELDHPDYFSSIEQIKQSFNRFVKNAERVYINADDQHSKGITHENIITYGMINDSEYFGKLEKNDSGTELVVYHKGATLLKIKPKLAGKHFAYDYLCAVAVSHRSNIAPCIISQALNSFSGVADRLDFVKKTDTGVEIFRDYAHHPSEIKCSIESLLSLSKDNILCVFQPHTYSRSVKLYKEFTKSFSGASKVVFLPTYKARETNALGLDENKFAFDCGGTLVESIQEIASLILSGQYKTVLIASAGDLFGLMDLI